MTPIKCNSRGQCRWVTMCPMWCWWICSERIFIRGKKKWHNQRLNWGSTHPPLVHDCFWTWQISNAARQLSSLAQVVNDDARFPVDVQTKERGWGNTPYSTCMPHQMIKEMGSRTGKSFRYISKLVEWSCKWSCFWNVESLGARSTFGLSLG